MVKKKRTPTPKQLANLARGRKILAQNQLRRMGINLNPRPQIIREVVRQPVINQITTHQHNIKFQLSLFNKLLETKLFTLEVNKNKEKLNFYEVINRIYSQLDNHQNKILTNEENINRIINFINSKSNKNSERFEKIGEENNTLKKEIKSKRKREISG